MPAMEVSLSVRPRSAISIRSSADRVLIQQEALRFSVPVQECPRSQNRRIRLKYAFLYSVFYQFDFFFPKRKPLKHIKLKCRYLRFSHHPVFKKVRVSGPRFSISICPLPAKNISLPFCCAGHGMCRNGEPCDKGIAGGAEQRQFKRKIALFVFNDTFLQELHHRVLKQQPGHPAQGQTY